MNIIRYKEMREDKDYSQADIAKVLKITQQQYSLYELGIRAMPIEKLDKLANFYNVSVDYLICRTDERSPYPKSKIYK